LLLPGFLIATAGTFIKHHRDNPVIKIKQQAMIDSQDTTPAEKDGKYEFKLFYSEREVTCRVEKEQNKLHVNIDDNLDAELQINNDGTITQVGGAKLPDSSVEFIKKQILGTEV